MDVDFSLTAIAPYKGFGCRPLEGRRRLFGGRRPKSLQRRKPRWRDTGRRRVLELRVGVERLHNLETTARVANGD